jgi:dienelactone hydrolase
MQPTSVAAAFIAAVSVGATPATAADDPLAGLNASCKTQTSKDPKPAPRVRYRICTAPVESFDGTPLDVTLTLPAKPPKKRLPLVVFLHGFLNSKGEYLSETREGTGADRAEGDRYKTVRWNNVWFASRGYAVVNYSARGHGDSGGQIELASKDVEVRDTQYLTGLLVDGAAPRIDRRRIGVVGGSYGGGQTWLLMTTRRDPSLQYGTWRSPAGRLVKLTAAVPAYTWTDLLYSLAPSGRHLSSGVDPATASAPVGIAKVTLIDGFLATAGNRLPQQTYAWLARTNAGEPYEAGDPVIEEARRELTLNRSAFYQDGYFEALKGGHQRRVPVLTGQGWTDPLFPPIEPLRMYRRLRQASPGYPIQIYLGDFEHLTAQAKVADMRHFHVLANRLLDRYLRGRGRRPLFDVSGAVTSCDPKRYGPVLTAPSWDDLTANQVRFPLAGGRQTVSPRPGGGADVLDPVVLSQQRGRGCVTAGAGSAPGSATYDLDVRGTIAGLPRVEIAYTATAPDFELNTHLWDVAPDGSRTLVDRGAYRGGPQTSGTAVFELFGSAWRVEDGHRLQLEIVQDDSTFLRTDNFPSTVSLGEGHMDLSIVRH